MALVLGAADANVMYRSNAARDAAGTSLGSVAAIAFFFESRSPVPLRGQRMVIFCLSRVKNNELTHALKKRRQKGAKETSAGN